MVLGVPRWTEPAAILRPGLGRPLILTNLEPKEAIRLLGDGRRGTTIAAICLAAGLGPCRSASPPRSSASSCDAGAVGGARLRRRRRPGLLARARRNGPRRRAVRLARNRGRPAYARRGTGAGRRAAVAIAIVVVVLVAIGGTLLYVRLTGGPGQPSAEARKASLGLSAYWQLL